MKKILVLMLVLLLPCAYALRTGVVVEFSGKVYEGCVEINQGKSAYDVLNEFNKQNDDIEMVFDGVLVGKPFLKSINGIEGKCEDTNVFNCMKWSGWNYWINDNDQGFTEPPELAPGWGMGLGDYVIEKENEIIAANFAITEYNADWSIKTGPQKPAFKTYSELCEKLRINEVEIRVDGKKEKNADKEGGSIDVEPGSEIKIEVEIENGYDDMDLEDVYVEALVEEIDDGSDIEEDTDEEDISPGSDEKFKIEFQLPMIIEEESYELVLKVFGKDENGMEFSQEIRYSIDVDKEKHAVIFENIKAEPEELKCSDDVMVSFTLLNIGKDDEDIRVQLICEDLEIYEERILELDEADSKREKFNLKIPEHGEYILDLKADYGKDIAEEEIEIVKDCIQQKKDADEIEEKTAVKSAKAEEVLDEELEKIRAKPEAVNIEGAVVAEVKEDNLMQYFIVGAFVIGILVAMAILAMLFSRRR